MSKKPDIFDYMGAASMLFLCIVGSFLILSGLFALWHLGSGIFFGVVSALIIFGWATREIAKWSVKEDT